MRLIDADAIPWTDLNSNNPNSDIKVLVTFAEKVNRMPTIEPERRKGKWVWSEENASWCCGACDCVFEEIHWRPEYNFCPNCGAEMEEE